MERRFGVCEWSLPVSGPLAIALAGEAGFDGVQLGEAGGRRCGYPLNHPAVQRQYREAADRWGVRLHSLNLGALLAEGLLNFPAGSSQGDLARESLERGFAACRALGTGVVVITADPSTEEALENAAAHIRFAETLAEEAGAEIAVECALPLERFQRLLDRIGSRCKICMDSLNPLRFGTGDPQAQIRLFGAGKISHFHLKDSVKALFLPGQRGCVPLGQGDGQYTEAVQAIRELNFQGWIFTENYYYLPPMREKNGDFLALAAKDLETMRRSLSR